jgi:hypothetical protein
MMELLVTRAPAALAAASTAMLCAHPARRSRTSPCSRSTVSMLCANTSSPEVATTATRSARPWKSGTSASTSSRPPVCSLSRAMVAAMWAAPKSGRSSLSTEVSTT